MRHQCGVQGDAREFTLPQCAKV